MLRLLTVDRTHLWGYLEKAEQQLIISALRQLLSALGEMWILLNVLKALQTSHSKIKTPKQTNIGRNVRNPKM